MVVLVGHLHVANRRDEIWNALHVTIHWLSYFVLQLWRWSIKGDICGSFERRFASFELVFVLRDTFALFGIKKGGGALNYFGRLF